MTTKIKVVNTDVSLNSKTILAYLRPQENSNDWESTAWASVHVEEGGSANLPAITNDISGVGSYNDGQYFTSEQIIPIGYVSTFKQEGNVIKLYPPVKSSSVTAVQSGMKNETNATDLYGVWGLNGGTICKTRLTNGDNTSFQLKQKIYFSVGDYTETETWKVQTWSDLQEFELPSNLLSATITLSFNKGSQKYIFTMSNEKYSVTEEAHLEMLAYNR
jgi:hypothetical protein